MKQQRRLKRQRPALTLHEIELLRRPEIPVESWRKGEALFGRKMERIARQQVVRLDGRDVTKNPLTRKIIADKAELRKLIANDRQLVKDFEFFTKTLAWEPEGLLQGLYWDCNMMHVRRQMTRERWPIERKTLERLCDDLSALSLRLEELDKTKFSPGQTWTLWTEYGIRLPRARNKYLLTAFRALPEILGFYSRELRRKVRYEVSFFSRQRRDWKPLIEMTRENSLYEKIRATTGKYQAVRLHRLVNAARQAQGLPSLELRAFVIWLNRLKARREKTKSLSSNPA